MGVGERRLLDTIALQLAIESTVIDSVGRGVSSEERTSGGTAAAGNVSDTMLNARAPTGSNVEKRLKERPRARGVERSASLIAGGNERRDMSTS